MKTEYSGVEIEYVESDNKWRFTLHGRERSASSLTLAKQAIDKEPKPKTKFEPIPAWLWNYSGPKPDNQPLVEEWVGLQKDLEAASKKINARMDAIAKELRRVDLSSIAEVAE